MIVSVVIVHNPAAVGVSVHDTREGADAYVLHAESEGQSASVVHGVTVQSRVEPDHREHHG